MDRKHLHPQAFAVFSVLVGLAIREELTRYIPDALAGTGQKAPMPSWEVMLFGLRVVTLSLVLIRFYLGSVEYFTEVYIDQVTSRNYGAKSYLLDFLTGLIHFTIFYAWAVTVNDTERGHTMGASHSLITGAFVL